MYSCENCQYKTHDKSNFNKHLKCIRHLENCPVEHQCNFNTNKNVPKSELQNTGEQNLTIVNKNEQDICEFCRKKLYNRSSLIRHLKICKKKTELDTIEKLKTDLKLKEQLLEHKNQLLENKDQILEYKEKNFNKELRKKNKLLKEQTLKIENNDKYIKSLLSNLNKTGSKNVNNINYIMINYNHAPAIEPINISKINILDYTPQNILLLMQNCKAKTLNDLLANTIVKEYKKENPELQSLWSTDPSRNNFIIREKNEKGEINWLIDKNGNKMTTYTVDLVANALEANLNKFTFDSSAHKKIQQKHLDVCIEKGIYMFKQIKLGYFQKNLTALIARTLFHTNKNT